MEKEEIESWYESQKKKLESQLLSKNLQESSYKEKMKKLRNKYTKLYKKYITKETKKQIKEIKSKKEPKQEKEIAEKQTYPVSETIEKDNINKINIFLKKLNRRIVPGSSVYLTKKFKLSILSSISYIFLSFSSYIKRKYIKIKNKIKSILSKIKNIWHTSLNFIKKLLPKKKKAEKK